MTGPAAEERRGPIMRLDVVTVFPDYLAPLRLALLGRAVDRGIIEVGVHDLRAWTHDVHKSVDDTPFGGGPGMVMRPTVWGDALDDLVSNRFVMGEHQASILVHGDTPTALADHLSKARAILAAEPR